jgi:hypothetical protein
MLADSAINTDASVLSSDSATDADADADADAGGNKAEVVS